MARRLVDHSQDEVTELALNQGDKLALNSVVGQDVLLQTLRVQIEDARRRSALLPHILLCGPPGRGKATFTAAIANELQRPCHVVDARSVRQIGALGALLTKIQEFDILGILDIDAVPGLIMESLVSAVENYQMKITIGKGPSEREIILALPRFTLIGLLEGLSRSTDYASVGYLILLVLFRIGRLSEALDTAKKNLQKDEAYGFSDLLRFEHQSFTLELLDQIEKLVESIEENTFNIQERIAAIRTFRLAACK